MTKTNIIGLQVSTEKKDLWGFCNHSNTILHGSTIPGWVTMPRLVALRLMVWTEYLPQAHTNAWNFRNNIREGKI